MDVNLVTRPAWNAIAIKSERNGRSVREAWKALRQILGERGFDWVNREVAYVFVPEWQWPTGVETLWVGVEVEALLPEHEPYFERFALPERRYASISIDGDRARMDAAYARLNAWFEENGYERDYSRGSFGFEANRLEPINPFDIPAEVIDRFDFVAYAPIR